jgi:hypothetical protein
VTYAHSLTIFVSFDYLRYINTRDGQNNGSTKKVRNVMCIGYIERASVGETEYFPVFLHSVAFVFLVLLN